jgi:carbon storage regulator CsrA
VCDHVGFFYSLDSKGLPRRYFWMRCDLSRDWSYAMLVLSRKNDETVVIGGGAGFERTIKVTVVEIGNGRVRLGFEADADVPVNRLEVWERIRGETRLADSG